MTDHSGLDDDSILSEMKQEEKGAMRYHLTRYLHPFPELMLNSTLFHRYTRSSQSLALLSISVLAADTKRSSACTSVDGMAAKRHTVHLIT